MARAVFTPMTLIRDPMSTSIECLPLGNLVRDLVLPSAIALVHRSTLVVEFAKSTQN